MNNLNEIQNQFAKTYPAPPTFLNPKEPNFYYQSYGERFYRFFKAYDWFCNLGIKLQPGRIHEYKKLFEKYKDNPEDLFKGPHDENFEMAVNALRETDEISWIHEGLIKHDEIYSKDVIQKMSDGGFKRKDDTTANQARDFEFELRIVTYFLRAGFPVDLSSDADIIVNIRGYSLYVECKRIKSNKQLYKRISEANLQLMRRYIHHVHPKEPVGLIVIDTYDLLFPNYSFIVSSSSEYIVNDIRMRLNKIANDKKVMRFKKQNRRTIGIWQNIIAPVFTVDSPQITTRFHSLYSPFCSLNTPFGRIWEEMRVSFEQTQYFK